jgi:hypothetical protein
MTFMPVCKSVIITACFLGTENSISGMKERFWKRVAKTRKTFAFICVFRFFKNFNALCHHLLLFYRCKFWSIITLIQTENSSWSAQNQKAIDVAGGIHLLYILGKPINFLLFETTVLLKTVYCMLYFISATPADFWHSIQYCIATVAYLTEFRQMAVFFRYKHTFYTKNTGSCVQYSISKLNQHRMRIANK